MDLKLDANHDLAIESGELVLLDGIEAVRQHILIRLQFFLGEWHLDQRIGVPYFQRILGAKPNESAVREILRPAIMAPGVVELSNYRVLYEPTTRALSVAFTAITDTGEPLVFDAELIIPPARGAEA